MCGDTEIERQEFHNNLKLNNMAQKGLLQKDYTLTDHVSYNEVVRSQTASKLGLDNTPTKENLENIKYILEKVFEPLRTGMGNKPIYISCAGRNKPLNDAVGGSKTSFHLTWQALDLDANVFYGMTNKQIFFYIYKNLPFTELIWEHGTDNEPDWVHVGLVKGRENEKEVLQTVVTKGLLKDKTTYKPFPFNLIKE